MTELALSNPTHNTHIHMDNNLAYNTHEISAYMHIPTVDNLAYGTHTHASSTQLPAPPVLSKDDSTYY